MTESVSHVKSWSTPRAAKAKVSNKGPPLEPCQPPSVEDITSYLSAFFYGLSVKEWKSLRLYYAKWSSGKGTAQTDIGLVAGDHSTCVRSRPCPDKAFLAQLDLNDLINALIDVIPSDAYALLLFVKEDTYEDEQDEFVCGRAYGGSRVADISTSRYNPVLDQAMGVSWTHMWPASHCSAYIRELGEASSSPSAMQQHTSSKKRKRQAQDIDSKTASHSDLSVHLSNPIGLPLSVSSSILSPKDKLTELANVPANPMRAALRASITVHPQSLQSLYLFRVVKKASHELCHYMGVGHCVYHACIIQ